MIRLVATDLDGTLVRSDSTISERSRRTLLAAEDAGVIVVFVTGRPLRWAREVFGHVGGHGLAVISNGALVWAVHDDEPVMVRPIPEDELLACAELLRRSVPGVSFAVETLAGIGLEPGFMERYRVPDGAARGPLESLVGTPVVKLLVRHEELDPQAFWRAADEVWDGRLTTTWSSSTTLLECSARHVTKASTLELVCAERGIDRGEVAAVGDMPNDLPMIEWAGLGCAVSNAHESVLAVADRVVPSNDDDGVAVLIESLLA